MRHEKIVYSKNVFNIFHDFTRDVFYLLTLFPSATTIVMAPLVAALLWFLVLILCYILIDGYRHQPRISGYHQRHILITGCDSGFGNLLAKALDSMGFPVIAGCLKESSQAELQRSCSKRLHAITLDVTSRESILCAYKYVNQFDLGDEGESRSDCQRSFCGWYRGLTL